MKYYPLMMNLQGRKAVVIGGGAVARRKVESLLDCGASVTVISPRSREEIEALARNEKIRLIEKTFDEAVEELTDDTALVFGTTDDRNANVRIRQEAARRRIPCNIADVPDLCTFIVPAVVRRGDLIVAVTTGGASPALAARIRGQLDETFGPEYAVMARLMRELRSRVLQMGKSSEENRRLFFRIVDSGLLHSLRDGNIDEAKRILRSELPEEIDPVPILEEALRNSSLKDTDGGSGLL